MRAFINKTLLEKVTKVETAMKDIENKFKCNECNFRTSSDQGLKSHITKKHKELNRKEENLKFPRPCDFCDEEFKNKREMNKHMIVPFWANISDSILLDFSFVFLENSFIEKIQGKNLKQLNHLFYSQNEHYKKC